MKNTFLFLCLIFGLWIIAGCEVPQPQLPVSEKDQFNGLKVDDLRDTTGEKAIQESLMNIRILTYTIIPGAADELNKIIETLSQNDVRAVNQNAFKTNGFAVGVGTVKQSRQIAPKLTEIGAVRVSQARLIMPPDKPEIVSRLFLSAPQKFTYSTGVRPTEILVDPGFIGWILTAKPDMRFRGMAQINLVPAFWQQGIENVRLLMGKEPVDFQPFDECRLLARVEENGFILLAPSRDITQHSTLDKLLFYLTGKRPRVQFFVIIYNSMGT